MKFAIPFLLASLLSSCTSVYSVKVRHDFQAPVEGTVFVGRILPEDDGFSQVEREKQLFTKALVSIGLTPVQTMKGADWVLFYHYGLKSASDRGFTLHNLGGNALVTQDTIYTTLFTAELLDSPGKPARWRADGIAATWHLDGRESERMIRRALKKFPGPVRQELKFSH